MKRWTIPVVWEMCGVVKVEAPTLKEAEHKANYDDQIELPEESFYVDGSFQTSYDEDHREDMRYIYNNGQQDEEV